MKIMKKITSLLILSIVVVGISVGPVFAEPAADLLKQITDLKKQVSDKDAIIMEQIKVILSIKDNFKQKYSDFDPVKYKSTGGFPTDWLDGEKSKITQTCNEAKAMGYENPYCKYVR